MKRVLLINIFCLTIGMAYAQQNINPSLEIKKDYDNKLPVIHKSKLNTSFNDSLNNFALNFNYSIFNKEYRDLYEFEPISFANIQKRETAYDNQFYAKLGIAFPFTLDAFAAYTPDLSKLGNNSKFLNSTNLMIYASNNTFKGDINSQAAVKDGDKYITKKGDRKFSAGDSRTDVGLSMGHYWASGKLTGNINYQHGNNKFYGENIYLNDIGYASKYSNIKSHNFNKASVNFNISSLSNSRTKNHFNYYGNLSYDFINDNSLEIISAHRLFADLTMGPSVGRYSKLLINLSLQNSNSEILNNSKYFGIFSISPSYLFERNRWEFSIGGTYSAKYSNFSASEHYRSLFVKAKAEYRAIPDKLLLFAAIDGGNSINDYSKLLMENPWISPFANTMISSIPISGSIGFNSRIKQIVDFGMKAGYIRHNGLPQFIISKDNPATFDVQYNNVNQLYVSSEISVTTKPFRSALNIRFNDYNGYKPINYPRFEASLSTEYNYMERIYVGLNLYARGKTPTKFISGIATVGHEDNYTYFNETQIDSFIDLGVNAKYVIDRHFSLFVLGENILGSNVCYYQQYYKKGISFGGGILVKF